MSGSDIESVTSSGYGPNGDYVVVELSVRAKKRINLAGVIALFFGISCFVALGIGASNGESPPVGGIIAFVVLGLFFTAFGLLMAFGSLGISRNERRLGRHQLMFDRLGYYERGTEHGEIFVPWSEFAGIDVVAMDPGGGYDPFTNAYLPTPNTRYAMGTTTAVRMYPTHPDEFARRVPFFTAATAPEFQRTLLDCPFGRVYYTEYDLRYFMLSCMRDFTEGRLGEGVDNTWRGFFRGSQF